MATIKKTFSDIDALLVRNPITNDLAIRTDSRAVSFAIKNLIQTMNGERPFNYNLGSPIKGLLFELSGDQLHIIARQIIIDTIRNYEPRAELIDVIIENDQNNNALVVTIIYKMINTQSPIELTMTLERTR